MGRLSSCIFKWDAEDYKLLLQAKRNEIIDSGLAKPSEDAVRKSVTKEELSKHCCRKTRDEQATCAAIEDLLLSLTSATDTLGVSLFKEEMTAIWTEEKKHLKCIQDVPDLPLYTTTNKIMKSGIRLPVYRCARGSTSLESFHHHIVTFVPGTSANAVHFQAYLLDGIVRWNSSRKQNALDVCKTSIRSFDVKMVTKVNYLSQQVHGKKLVAESSPPNKYTGEKIGIEYLYQQSGSGLLDKDISNQIDEGCHVEEDEDQDIEPGGYPYIQLPTCGSDNQNSDKEDEIEVDTPEESAEGSVDESVDFYGIPGWDKVDKLAHALLNLIGLVVTTEQAVHIKQLYNNLLPYDKKPLEYKAIVKRPTRGRFARSKHRSSYVGRDAMKRCFFCQLGLPLSLHQRVELWKLSAYDFVTVLPSISMKLIMAKESTYIKMEASIASL